MRSGFGPTNVANQNRDRDLLRYSSSRGYPLRGPNAPPSTGNCCVMAGLRHLIFRQMTKVPGRMHQHVLDLEHYALTK
jgi:hypothetical protein